MRLKPVLTIGLGVTLLCIGWLSVDFSSKELPGFSEFKQTYERSDTIMLDRSNRLIHESRVDFSGRRLEWVSLEGVSPALKEAVVRAEDRRFYTHGGVDWMAFAGGFRDSLVSGRRRGASTITMQLAALIDPDFRPKNIRRTIDEKLVQISAARDMERKWTKDEILEAYLNLVSFRGELQGVAAASRGLFRKDPHGLQLAEALVMASLIRSPNASSESVRNRALSLAMELGRVINADEIMGAVRAGVDQPYFVEARAQLAPHAVRLLTRDQSSPTRLLKSTLDGDLQRYVVEVVQSRLKEVSDRNVDDASVLVVDTHSGEVLAYVGNGGHVSSARYVDGIQARRQAGSTLKPFLYGMAFERRLLTPASLIDDSPLDIPVQGGIYRPSNYDNRFRGPVTCRLALGSSLNVPAVRVLQLVGVEAFVQRLGDLGFESLRSAEYYGPSLALGSADVTLWDLVNAYRVIASGGIWTPMSLERRSGENGRRRVFSEQVSYLLSKILSDRGSRYATFDLESPLSTRFWCAVKTGTSKDMRDNWCVGFSDQYTVGVWVGNFSGEPMWNVSGITGAAPLWLDIMDWLHNYSTSREPTVPSGVVSTVINVAGCSEPSTEWFLKGTEPKDVRLAEREVASRIIYPPSGTIIALDPDIPDGHQKVFFEAFPSAVDLRWVLNGTEIGSAVSFLPWAPEEGRYSLSLVNRSGKIVDSVEFLIRGSWKSTVSQKSGD